MKRLLLLLSLVFALSTVNKATAQITGISFATVAINATDTVKTGDTIYVKPGLTLVAPYDTLNVLKFYLPATPKDGQIFHITVTKRVTNVTYLHGTTVQLPSAIQNVTATALSLAFNSSKQVAYGGKFAIIYRAKKDKWYPFE